MNTVRAKLKINNLKFEAVGLRESFQSYISLFSRTLIQ